jgi:hypothetical protein
MQNCRKLTKIVDTAGDEAMGDIDVIDRTLGVQVAGSWYPQLVPLPAAESPQMSPMALEKVYDSSSVKPLEKRFSMRLTRAW